MTAILSSPREQWLARRREMVTASDVPAILGIHPSRTAAMVYAEKLGHEQEETPAMRRGREHEALIAREYEETTGRPVRDLGAYEIQVHPDVPWLGATLDRVTRWERFVPSRSLDSDEPMRTEIALVAPLEIKRHLGRARDWSEGIPLDVQAQLQVEMACYRTDWGTPAEWGTAAAEISNGPIVHFDMQATVVDLGNGRSMPFVETILPALEVFRRQVRDRVVPDVTDRWADRWALKALFPGVDGRTIDLDAEQTAMLDELEAARQAARECQRGVEAMRNKLERAMAGAQFAYTNDGRLLTRAPTHRRAFEVAETDYIRLVVSRPRRRG